MLNIKRNILQFEKINSRFLYFFFSFVILVFYIFSGFSTAFAADQLTTRLTTDPVYIHCKSLKLSKQALKACNQSNVDAARTTGAKNCDKNASSDKKVACVQKKAKAYFTEAAKSKPKTATSFTKSLKKVLEKEGYERTETVDGFGANDPQTVSADPASEKCTSDKCDFVKKYVNPAINLFTFSFGLIAVISLIIGGIQYSASGGDPQSVAKAKKRITDTILAIVAYFFLYAFLQFLVPGGLFN